MALTITKDYTWPMGHRLPDHDGPCRNLHGHNYKLRVTIARDDVVIGSGPQHGMVLDFSRLSHIVKSTIVQKLDHAFAWWEKDPLLKKLLPILEAESPAQKTLLLPFPATAENLSVWIAEQLQSALQREDPAVRLVELTLWETETSCATWRATD